MALPVAAIVGRPNVGKSTLFNKLIGQRLSIVKDTPGVTRDRIYAKCEWCSKEFMLVDTGGIEPETDDIILSQMKRQAELAIQKADVIIFVTDLQQLCRLLFQQELGLVYVQHQQTLSLLVRLMFQYLVNYQL